MRRGGGGGKPEQYFHNEGFSKNRLVEALEWLSVVKPLPSA